VINIIVWSIEKLLLFNQCF